MTTAPSASTTPAHRTSAPPARHRSVAVVSLACSALLHAAIVLVCLLGAGAAGLGPPPGPEPVVSFFDPAFSASLDAPADPPDLAMDLADEADPADALRSAPSDPLPLAGALAPIPWDTPTNASPLSPVTPDAPASAGDLAPLIGSLLSAPAAEPVLPMPGPAVSTTDLALERRLPDVRLLGARSSNAESIVYVVDATGSMLTTMPIVKRELLASIERLTPVQRFQVVFFRGDAALAAPHPDLDPDARAVQMLRATTANKRLVAQWIEQLTTSGRATPIHALRMALVLQPDVVFLLSSGDNTARDTGGADHETRAILAELESLNPVDPRSQRRRIPIKVIHFLSPDESGLLQAIADTHGGTDGYKFVSRQDLGLQ
jgi:hypothetical protein